MRQINMYPLLGFLLLILSAIVEVRCALLMF